MEKIDYIVQKRNENYKIYHENIINNYWKIKPTDNSFVSNFAYPIITPKIKELIKSLKDNDIETRPLICGSISNQPFWTNIYGVTNENKYSNEIDKFGLYLPNNHNLTKEEILFVCDVVNNVLN